MALISHLALASGGRAVFQAEDMEADGVTWKVQPHYPNWYRGQPVGSMLRGSQGGAGEATYRITLAPGDWRLWVRYLDVRVGRGPFSVTISQNKATLARKVFDTETLHPMDGRYALFVWDYMDIAGVTEHFPVEIVVSKEQPVNCNGHARQLDLFVLADDHDYVPEHGEFYTPLWVKIRLGEEHPQSSRMYLFGKTPPNPGVYTKNCFIDRRGLNMQLGGTKAEYLDPGEKSPWVNIAPLLAPAGLNALRFRAMTNWGDAGVEGADFELLVADDPDETAVFKRFARSGSGSALTLAVDLSKRGEISSELEWSREALAAARALPPSRGRRARLFPILTGLAIDIADNPREVIDNELEIMRRLGFSGLYGHSQIFPLVRESGLIHPASGSFACWRERDESCFAQPRFDNIRKIATNVLVRAFDRGATPESLAYFQFMDEPRAARWDHLTSCPSCAEGLRIYLRDKQSLSPEYFGRGSWEEIVPTSERDNARLYYWTARYRMWQMADFLKIGTDALSGQCPGVRTMVNFLQPTYNGNLAEYGMDWFEILGEGALSYGWTQDWSNFQTTYQIAGYDWTLLRAACRKRGLEWGGYTIIRAQPWDTVTKQVAKLAYGARATHLFNYGPKYLISTDQHSHRYELYPALTQVNHAIGEVEHLIMEGRPWDGSRMAMLYPRSSDIWAPPEGASLHGKERQLFWLLLRHLGYFPEIIEEDDISASSLQRFDALIAHGTHLKRSAALSLAKWVRDGGTLYLGAGSLLHDEYNQPLDFDKAVGIDRGEFVFGGPVLNAQDINHLGGRKVMATANFGGGFVEEICGVQEIRPWIGARSLLSLDDGRIVLASGPVGAGKVIAAGIFPGIGYARSGVQARVQRDAEVSSNPPSFARVYRDMIEAALSGAASKSPVTTNHYLVEAGLLQGIHGWLITLVNWSGAPTGVRVRISAPPPEVIPLPVVGHFSQVERQGDDLLLTLDVGAFDLIKLSTPVTMP